MVSQVISRVLPAVALALSLPTCRSEAAEASPSPPTVLAVYWSAEDFPSAPVLDGAIRQVLQSRGPDRPVDYYTEYLESDRFPEPAASEALRDYIRKKYRGRRIDVVIAVSDPALQFVLRYRAELFPHTPIVFTGVSEPAERVRRAGAGLTGVASGVAYSGALALALKLHPSTERVFVVAQAPAPESQYLDFVKAALQAFAKRVTLVYVSEKSVSQLMTVIRSIPPQSLVLYLRQSQEDPGRVLFPEQIARLVAQASPVPVYGVNDMYVGSGIVGGMMRGTRLAGTRAGELATQILDGRRAQDIPIEHPRLVPTFDWRQLRRWKIDIGLLPRDSDIRFKVATPWELYRWYIAGTVSLVGLQALLIAGLLAQRVRRRRAEEAIRANEAALRTSYERIRQLAGRLITAKEAERTRIARDLHDDVCQQLAVVSLTVSDIKRRDGDVQDARTQEALAHLQRRTLGLVEDVRRLSHDLHPSILRHVGLVSALQVHCAENERRFEVQIAFQTDGDLGNLAENTALCLFRISQEALRNASIHAEARRITVSIARVGEEVELTVADDGKGFDRQTLRDDGDYLGLISMEERARLVGGHVRISTRPGQGTTIQVRVPAGGRVETDDAAVEDDSHIGAFVLQSNQNTGERT